MVALCGISAAAQAQVEIAWSLAKNRTVLMEPVRASVRLSNYSGQTLDLTANGNARLSFLVEDQPTSTVPGTGRPLLDRAVLIPAGETREVDVNLLDAYRIIRGQSYMLTPVLEFAGVRFSGPRLSLEVQPGLELLKRNTGMPKADDAREITLRMIHREQSDWIFFRIDNPTSGYCLGVYELGRLIRFFPPGLEQDRDGVFHVLHQEGPARFTHTMFGYDGEPRGAEYYVAQVGGIRLAKDEDGTVKVAGGTLYTEDPENPGMLTAPALPPSHPYNRALGEGTGADKAPAAEKPLETPKKSRVPAASEKSDAGSEPISW